jgi:hypothetical protein
MWLDEAKAKADQLHRPPKKPDQVKLTK